MGQEPSQQSEISKSFFELFKFFQSIDLKNDWKKNLKRISDFLNNKKILEIKSSSDVKKEVFKVLLSSISSSDEARKFFNYAGHYLCDNRTDATHMPVHYPLILPRWIALCNGKEEIEEVLEDINIGATWVIIKYRGFIEMCYKRLDEIKVENKKPKSIGGKGSGS